MVPGPNAVVPGPCQKIFACGALFLQTRQKRCGEGGQFMLWSFTRGTKPSCTNSTAVGESVASFAVSQANLYLYIYYIYLFHRSPVAHPLPFVRVALWLFAGGAHPPFLLASLLELKRHLVRSNAESQLGFVTLSIYPEKHNRKKETLSRPAKPTFKEPKFFSHAAPYHMHGGGGLVTFL